MDKTQQSFQSRLPAFNNWKSNQHFVDATSGRKTISLHPKNQDGRLQGNGFSSLFSYLRLRINRARHHPKEPVPYASEVFAYKTKENRSVG